MNQSNTKFSMTVGKMRVWYECLNSSLIRNGYKRKEHEYSEINIAFIEFVIENNFL